ncbi:PilN domain-containing protein [Ectobacillus panaciterrae]|uniref:PilN domain-containing protein n=1 Tax=Ectobacillus panaciterrae TaxID=363872 RepID=UPI0004074B42|nr:hypothetical protein [Ectobacillus panaciterrae]
MVANINLLPKREKETSSSLILVVTFLAVLLAGGGWMYYKINSINEEAAAVKKQLLVAKVQTEQHTANAVQSQQAAEQLVQGLKKLEADQVKTVPLLKKTTSFLPARGVFQAFSYKETGIMIIEIRFDDKSAAAYFYSRLQEEDWVQEAKLSSLKAIEVQDEQGKAAGMPRYLAHYEITVKRDKAKALEKEEKS